MDRSIFPYEHYDKTADKKAENYLNQAKELSGYEQMEKLKMGVDALRTGYENFIQKQLFGIFLMILLKNLILVGTTTWNIIPPLILFLLLNIMSRKSMANLIYMII